MATNKYGLSRHNIPAAVKRIVRQKSGFGCVICGLGIYQYDHVDPVFSKCRNHDPECMTLLCPNCHSKVTTKMWSREKVKKAMRAPRSFTRGYSNEFFDIGDGHPVIVFGGAILENCTIPVMIRQTPLFTIRPSSETNKFLISASFYNKKERLILKIEDNEWQAFTSSWDIEVIGPKLTIREKLNDLSLVLIAKPPDRLIVSRIKLSLHGYSIVGNEKEFTVMNGESSNTFSKCFAKGSSIGFRLD